jgi:hypothetical protein
VGYRKLFKNTPDLETLIASSLLVEKITPEGLRVTTDQLWVSCVTLSLKMASGLSKPGSYLSIS